MVLVDPAAKKKRGAEVRRRFDLDAKDGASATGVEDAAEATRSAAKADAAAPGAAPAPARIT
jgi:hypothetical protein